MPKFSYVAMDPRGKETKGTIEGASLNEAKCEMTAHTLGSTGDDDFEIL